MEGTSSQLAADGPPRTPARKVLMLTWEFPPRIVGGIATHVYHLSQALCRQGLSVDVVTCGFPNAPHEEVVDGVRVTRVENDRIPETDFLLWIYRLNSQLIEAGDRLLAEGGYEVIHAHDWLVGRAAIELKNRYRLPLVTTIHATEMGRGPLSLNGYRRTIHEIERLLGRLSDRIICCSLSMARAVEETLGVPPSQIDIIPNGVNVSKFNVRGDRAPAAADGAPAGEQTILFVGRLVHEKGLHSLLGAFQAIAKKAPRARLVIVGDGPIRRNLAEESVRRGLQTKVRFEGFVEQSTLTRLLRTSDVFVMPSLYEPFGIAALEAMASDTPVVVSDVGGLGEIVEEGVTGLKVPPGNISALAQAILRVLEDPALAATLRQNAYQLVASRYSWEGVAARTIETFGRVHRGAGEVDAPIRPEQFLRDPDLLHLMLTTGATEDGVAKSATEIAEFILAPAVEVKTILGRQASQGYVCVSAEAGQPLITYHLSKRGILKACSEFS